MNIALLMEDIRKTPLFRQLVPQEAGIGWPIPLRRNKEVFVTLPCFGLTRSSTNAETTLYPPFATITVNWSNQTPVEYVNLHFRHPWPEGNWEGPVGTFPHPLVVNLPVGQYLELRKELLAMYDVLLDALAKDEPLSTTWNASFSLLLRTLIEPPLEPYYRALGPKFFEQYLPKLETTASTV